MFLLCGRRAITHRAATRHLARNHERPARTYGSGSCVLLLKVVDPHAYGPDVVEPAADVTRAARAPLPDRDPAPRHAHRAPWTAVRAGRCHGDDGTGGPLRVGHNPSGAQLTFSSSANDPWCVSVPLREQ